MTRRTTVRAQSGDLDRLLAFAHAQPHSFLGAHPTGRSVVVRALDPDAEHVWLHADGHAPQPMRKVHPAGLFEVAVPRAKVFPYRLEVHYPGGAVVTRRDPYAFPPTLGDFDLHLAKEGRHEDLYEKLGAHAREIGGVGGVSFAVWAPTARAVSVVGDFNRWDGRRHPMRSLGATGIWELFVPDLPPGVFYKFEIHGQRGPPILKGDPFAFAAEEPPGTASRVYRSTYKFRHARPGGGDPWKGPFSIYEVHLGSWRRVPEEGNRPFSYREIAPLLADYVAEMGFTHVEILPVMEHPFGGSWGYQVTHYFAPTARWGEPDDLRFLIDELHGRGIGVILDWVPAHFPKDAHALGRFDGTALYEHLDPRQGEHPDWGTFIFNYGRPEVRNFLLAAALYWLDEYQADGLRTDAVASMIYLDYSRRHGEWVANRYGGRENLEAISFLRELNAVVHARRPDALMIAEESTAWPGVSRPAHLGGLGFGFKWNLGWMHDTLSYFAKDSVHRKYHHTNLTFALLYAWHENFILPLSHDEVVHGKGSLLAKMSGDRWQAFANLRALLALQWAHPGKKLLFMGAEIGQVSEWNADTSLDWHLLADDAHAGLQRLVGDLNRVYRAQPALWERDFDPAGFTWIDCNDADENVLSFRRIAPSTGREVVCVANLSPVPRGEYRVGLPRAGFYREILNTDSALYGGSNLGNAGGVEAEAWPCHGLPWSAPLMLPPLAVVWFEAP